jgi:ubiquinone/menaquinone biosynthesis C-methylase UbiE
VSDRPTFRTDLYRGTASFYDRFRLPYPAALIDDACRRAGAHGTGRLLDLACGPGTVTFALADRFAEVWAVDQEPEAIELARRKADQHGVHNVRWIAARADDVAPDEMFDVVTIGTAFHRLDRRSVAARAAHWLRGGGHLVLLWSDTPVNPASPWQQELVAIVEEWIDRVGSRDRVPPELAEHLERLPHSTVLEAAGFVDGARYEFREPHTWTVPELLGLLYSTSLLSLAVLGDRRGAFEADVEARLGAMEPTGRFLEDASFAYDIAYRPRTLGPCP